MPNLQPYANPVYFVYLLLGLAPIVVGLLLGKRWRLYETAISLVFLFLIFDADKWQQGVALIIYVLTLARNLTIILNEAPVTINWTGRNSWEEQNKV